MRLEILSDLTREVLVVLKSASARIPVARAREKEKRRVVEKCIFTVRPLGGKSQETTTTTMLKNQCSEWQTGAGSKRTTGKEELYKHEK